MEKKKIKDNIYYGEAYWSDEILDGLEPRELDGKIYMVYPDEPISMYESLRRAKNRWSDKICLVDNNGKTYTYSYFLKLVDGLSAFLHQKYEINPGEHIGVLLYNSIEYCACIYALSKLRAVMVPLSTKYKKQETEALIEKADLSGIIFHEDFENWFLEEKIGRFQICLDLEQIEGCIGLEERKEQLPRENDKTILMFTSGTTSRSKGVILKNYNIMYAIAVYQKIFHITSEDKTILPIPAYHITGLVAVIGLFIHAGGTVWIHKYFRADRILSEMKKQEITFFHASPTVFSMLLEKKGDYPNLPSLKTMACGSGKMPQKKIWELKEWIPSMEFHTVYGLTETSSPAAIFPGDCAKEEHEGAAGHVVPGLEFKICGESGQTVGIGKAGSILIRGTCITDGYYGQEDLGVVDGWLDTGDIGCFDEDGYLYILDRKKDMINRGGEKVCSIDVESIIYEMEAVKDVAVVGIENDTYGEVPAAMIVPKKGVNLSEDEVRLFLKSRLAKFQTPEVIFFVESLPMTPNMKIDKKKIRDILMEEK